MENRQINKKIYITKEEIIPMAQRMRSEGRALLLIHGHRDEDGKPIVSYEFFVDQDIESYEVQGEEVLPDITDIYDLAAQWPEQARRAQTPQGWRSTRRSRSDGHRSAPPTEES